MVLVRLGSIECEKTMAQKTEQRKLPDKFCNTELANKKVSKLGR
jgi:hypothetical protein